MGQFASNLFFVPCAGGACACADGSLVVVRDPNEMVLCCGKKDKKVSPERGARAKTSAESNALPGKNVKPDVPASEADKTSADAGSSQDKQQIDEASARRISTSTSRDGSDGVVDSVHLESMAGSKARKVSFAERTKSHDLAVLEKESGKMVCSQGLTAQWNVENPEIDLPDWLKTGLKTKDEDEKSSGFGSGIS